MLAFEVKILPEQVAEGDYTILHDLMFRNGFFRSLRGTDGTWYQLPPMEYSHYSAFDLSPTMVREKVVKIAAATGKRFSVVVSKHHAVARPNQSALPERILGTL